VLDGLVYGAVVGLGFGVLENFAYYTQEADVVSVLVRSYQRGLLMGLGTHAVYTGITGVSLGLFRVMRTGPVRWLIPPIGLGLAMFTHFAWNTFQGLFVWESQGGVFILFVSYPTAVVVLQTPFVLLVLIVAVLALRHERKVIEQHLSTESVSVVDPGEIALLVPATRRSLHLAGLALSLRGREWWRRRRRNRLLVRLAFEKWHMHGEREAESHYAHWHAVRVRRLRERLKSR
jgi:hypothetical protein